MKKFIDFLAEKREEAKVRFPRPKVGHESKRCPECGIESPIDAPRCETCGFMPTPGGLKWQARDDGWVNRRNNKIRR